MFCEYFWGQSICSLGKGREGRSNRAQGNSTHRMSLYDNFAHQQHPSLIMELHLHKKRKAEKSLGGLRGMVGLELRADVGKSIQEPWEAQRMPCFTLHSGFLREAST